MAVFSENEVGITGDNEACPQCGDSGYLMDMGTK
jgi:ribosomal protein S27AE